MKRFSFRLEKLLHIREAAESEQARELAHARIVVDEKQQALEESRARQAGAERDLVRAQSTGMTAGVLTTLNRSVQAMRRESENRREALRAAEARVTVERERYTEVRKERETLERLKTRQFEEWRAEVGSRDQKEMDAVAAQVAQRNSRSER